MKTLRKYLSTLFPYRTRLAIQISVSSSIARLVPGRIQQNIAFFHIGRSGSTVLVNALSQHSKINSRGEIFHEKTPWTDKGKINYDVKDILLSQRLNFGFQSTLVEIKFSKLDDLERIDVILERLIALLKQAGYDYFVILERRNKLRHQVSVLQGHTRGQWHYSPQDKVPQVQVNFEPSMIIKKIELLEHEYDQLRELLKGENTLEIYYEDDVLHNLRGTYEKVCYWLGIKPEDYTVETKLLNTQPLNKSISNYDEVLRALEGTKYEWMLEQANTH